MLGYFKKRRARLSRQPDSGACKQQTLFRYFRRRVKAASEPRRMSGNQNEDVEIVRDSELAHVFLVHP